MCNMEISMLRTSVTAEALSLLYREFVRLAVHVRLLARSQWRVGVFSGNGE